MELPDLYFTDLFENTSDLIHYVSVSGIIEKVNPAWLSTLGYKYDEVIGKSVYEFVDQEEVSVFKAYRENILNKGSNEDIQVTFLTKYGLAIILQGHLRPIFINGILRHTRGVFRDVTSKIEAVKLQEEHLVRITEFLAHAPDAVVIIDEKQHVVEWNLKAFEIFGYSSDEVLHHSLAALIIPPQFRKAHNNGMARFLNTGHGPFLNKTIEIPAIDKNLREFPISLSISAIKINSKWFFIAFISDITDKKEKERSLIEKELELERSQLDSHRHKEFLTIASHELRTPLTSLKAFLQLGIKGFHQERNSKAFAFLNKAEEASNKLGNLISNLLDISRIHSGKLKLEKESVELTRLLQEIIHANQLLYSTHKLDFSFSENITIEVDKVRIEQVFVNLISNAVKYSPNADKVVVSVEKKDQYVQIGIRDFGVGISAENQIRIFDKFFRVEELSDTHTSGLGIGLFVSSEIIQQHQGTIWVENNVDGGSTFYITLPLH